MGFGSTDLVVDVAGGAIYVCGASWYRTGAQKHKQTVLRFANQTDERGSGLDAIHQCCARDGSDLGANQGALLHSSRL